MRGESGPIQAEGTEAIRHLRSDSLQGAWEVPPTHQYSGQRQALGEGQCGIRAGACGEGDTGLPPWHQGILQLQSYWCGLLGGEHPLPASPPLPPLTRTHLVVAGSVRDRTKLLGDGVAHGVGLAVFDVDGANEQVIGDVVQVPTELEPGARSRDVVGGTLPFDLGWVRRQRSGHGAGEVDEGRSPLEAGSRPSNCDPGRVTRAAGLALDTQSAALALPHCDHEGSGQTVPDPLKALHCSVTCPGQDTHRGQWLDRQVCSLPLPT